MDRDDEPIDAEYTVVDGERRKRPRVGPPPEPGQPLFKPGGGMIFFQIVFWCVVVWIWKVYF